MCGSISNLWNEQKTLFFLINHTSNLNNWLLIAFFISERLYVSTYNQMYIYNAGKITFYGSNLVSLEKLLISPIIENMFSSSRYYKLHQYIIVWEFICDLNNFCCSNSLFCGLNLFYPFSKVPNKLFLMEMIRTAVSLMMLASELELRLFASGTGLHVISFSFFFNFISSFSYCPSSRYYCIPPDVEQVPSHK